MTGAELDEIERDVRAAVAPPEPAGHRGDCDCAACRALGRALQGHAQRVAVAAAHGFALVAEVRRLQAVADAWAEYRAAGRDEWGTAAQGHRLKTARCALVALGEL